MKHKEGTIPIKQDDYDSNEMAARITWNLVKAIGSKLLEAFLGDSLKPLFEVAERIAWRSVKRIGSKWLEEMLRKLLREMLQEY